MKQPEFFLRHIIKAAEEINTYVAGVNRDEFIKDSMRYNATIRLIEVIGEAISKLEATFILDYPDIPWQEIKAMRNILIHEYWQTDLDEVYHSATIDVPELIKLILPILEQKDAS